jgi:hypothetical protein
VRWLSKRASTLNWDQQRAHQNNAISKFPHKQKSQNKPFRRVLARLAHRVRTCATACMHARHNPCPQLHPPHPILCASIGDSPPSNSRSTPESLRQNGTRSRIVPLDENFPSPPSKQHIRTHTPFSPHYKRQLNPSPPSPCRLSVLPPSPLFFLLSLSSESFFLGPFCKSSLNRGSPPCNRPHL